MPAGSPQAAGLQVVIYTTPTSTRTDPMAADRPPPSEARSP